MHSTVVSGRKHRLSPAAERKLVRMVNSQPKTTQKQVCNELQAAGSQISVSTVRCILHQHGLRGCCARKKLLIQIQHLKAGLKFAADHRDKVIIFWRKTLWSHETKTELFDYNEHQYVWRRGEAFNSKNLYHTYCQAWCW